MKRASLIALAGVALLGGCVKQEYGQQARVNQDPLVIDEAMQLRNWDKSYSIYQNGGTENWSTGFAYIGRGDIPQGLNYITDIGVFGLNIVTLPYTAYEQRKGVESSGVNVPETYTAVPPLPPRSADAMNGGAQSPSAAAGSNGNAPINTINNPDAENGNTVNPTFPNSPQYPGNSNSAGNSAGNAAANDTSSGANGGAPANSGSSLGSGAGSTSGGAKAGK